jgi:hypothetical protein
MRAGVMTYAHFLSRIYRKVWPGRPACGTYSGYSSSVLSAYVFMRDSCTVSRIVAGSYV